MPESNIRIQNRASRDSLCRHRTVPDRHATLRPQPRIVSRKLLNPDRQAACRLAWLPCQRKTEIRCSFQPESPEDGSG
jgi:hypothetical protein